MWLVRNKDIASYDKHSVTDNAVIQLTHGFSILDQRRVVRAVWSVWYSKYVTLSAENCYAVCS